jgi:parvin
LIEKLTGEKLDVPEVTQSEEGQKQKLGIVLTATNRVSSSIHTHLIDRD